MTDSISALEGLGLGHLYVPLDPYLDAHSSGAVAPDTAVDRDGRSHRGRKHAVAAANRASCVVVPATFPVRGIASASAPPVNYLDGAVLRRVATQRRNALRRRSDLALGRTTERPPVDGRTGHAATAVPNCPPPPRPHGHADVRVDPRFNLTSFDTVQIPSGATRRARFRW